MIGINMFVICNILIAFTLTNGSKTLVHDNVEGKLIGKEDAKNTEYLVDFTEGLKIKYSDAIGNYTKVSVLKTDCIKE
jgi:hypothetical protein